MPQFVRAVLSDRRRVCAGGDAPRGRRTARWPAPRPPSRSHRPALGRDQGKIGFHGGKVEVRRPRLRSLAGREVPLPNWQAAQAEAGLAGGR